ncbi:OmpA/MotB domain-containing protein [Caballeronia hypogeia]|uniref:OmpA/MotB domain-containing protein n=1 Tax=Caballeronia hypogeia TaxID=1777140 RepID=A0A158DPV2_9BURK|nr:hypothetical protein [Caballeronia hypogeia]SAK96440.1 OmpA/MotB domain-containing protein [Caballeronia hypogeia]
MISRILFVVLAAVGVLQGCTTDSGLTYTSNKVNIAGKGEAYRVTCNGLFQSQNACMAGAVRICADKQVVLLEAIDGVKGAQARNNAREVTFMCQGNATQKPAS